MSFSLQSFMIVFSTFSCIVILLCFSYRKIFYNLLSSFKLLSIKRRVSKTLNQGSLGPQGPWLIMHLNLLFIWVCLNRCDICKYLYINIYHIFQVVLYELFIWIELSSESCIYSLYSIILSLSKWRTIHFHYSMHLDCTFHSD